MKLYSGPGSPYARIVRIVILERGLADRVEIVPTQTRVPDSPYYAINPSGRIPYLLRDDGTGIEDSVLISSWLDQLDGRPAFVLPPGAAGWEARRLEAIARSMMDGLAVWSRERSRPPGERSPKVIAHESSRSQRLADFWERAVDHPWMRGPLNMAQITLACALGLEGRLPEFHWRGGRPQLVAWYEPIAARPSFAATAPPPLA